MRTQDRSACRPRATWKRTRPRKKHRTARLLVLVLAVWGLIAASCGLDTAIDNASQRATQAIDRATERLAGEADDFQEIFDGLAAELGDEAIEVVAEVEAVANRVVAAAGVEFRCNADFIRNRARQDLAHIKGEILAAVTLDLYEPTPPPRFPVICSAPVPALIRHGELPDSILISGYDLDAEQVRFLIEDVNGSTRDVTDAVAISTKHYQRLLPFGANAVLLRGGDRRVVVAVEGETIAEVPVIEPAVPACRTEVIGSYQPDPIDLIPLHVDNGGDRDFHGNGPNILVTATLTVSESAITAAVTMDATETKEDFTSVSGQRTAVIFEPDPGWRISRLLTPTQLSSSQSYEDNDHADDMFAGTGPVKWFEIVGDTPGEDAEQGTQVRVDFERLKIEVVQTTDCVDPAIYLRGYEEGVLQFGERLATPDAGTASELDAGLNAELSENAEPDTVHTEDTNQGETP